MASRRSFRDSWGNTMPVSGSNEPAAGAIWEPQAAETRLAQTAGSAPGGLFSSDLSVSEYALLGEAGFEPLGFVVGSSIFPVGIQGGRWCPNAAPQGLPPG